MNSKTRKILIAVLVVALLAGTGFGVGLPRYQANQAALKQAGTMTDYKASDGREYMLYVPKSYKANVQLPLVVMLHGCLEDPKVINESTGLQVLADKEGFAVVYPKQYESANPAMCWNWFLPSNQVRGKGEPASIVGIVDEVKAKIKIDPKRVYAEGFSSGACTSMILGITYPDVFAAIGVIAGVQYKAATSPMEAGNLTQTGGPDPDVQGKLAFEAMAQNARVVPTIVWQGSKDYIVTPVCSEKVISQMAQTNDLALNGADDNDIDDVADEVITGVAGKEYTRYIYKNKVNNAIVMEKYVVDGLTHAISGGIEGTQHVDPEAPKAIEINWAFFKQFTK